MLKGAIELVPLLQLDDAGENNEPTYALTRTWNLNGMNFRTKIL